MWCFYAADGYSDSLTIERAMMDDMMIAYSMNGVPLPLGHGFPARIIAPGHYGMKHVHKMGVWRSFIRVLMIILHVEFGLPTFSPTFFRDVR